MAWNPTEEEMKALISDSVKIVNEDREREHYGRLHEKYGEKPEPKDEPGEGDPPPKKDPPADPPKKPGLWFGNRTND